MGRRGILGVVGVSDMGRWGTKLRGSGGVVDLQKFLPYGVGGHKLGNPLV